MCWIHAVYDNTVVGPQRLYEAKMYSLLSCHLGFLQCVCVCVCVGGSKKQLFTMYIFYKLLFLFNFTHYYLLLVKKAATENIKASSEFIFRSIYIYIICFKST